MTTPENDSTVQNHPNEPGAEPALSIEQGRPTKRDRRDIERTQHDWQRWSASLDDT